MRYILLGLLDASDAAFGTVVGMIIGALLMLVLLKQRKAAIEEGLDWSTTWGWLLPYKLPMAALGLFWALLALSFQQWAILGLALGLPIGYLVIKILKIDITPTVDERKHQPQFVPPEGYDGD